MARMQPDRAAEIQAARRELYEKHGDGDLMVYVFREGESGPVKIGKTTGDPLVRLATLQCGNSAKLICWAAWDALPGEEEFLHALFAEHRIRGEWFEPDESLLWLTASEGGAYVHLREQGVFDEEGEDA